MGCDVIRENNGIRGIRERVEQAGGTVRFSSSAGEGFLMRVRVPV
jgi:signal transduction histidine kinase